MLAYQPTGLPGASQCKIFNAISATTRVGDMILPSRLCHSHRARRILKRRRRVIAREIARHFLRNNHLAPGIAAETPKSVGLCAMAGVVAESPALSGTKGAPRKSTREPAPRGSHERACLFVCFIYFCTPYIKKNEVEFPVANYRNGRFPGAGDRIFAIISLFGKPSGEKRKPYRAIGKEVGRGCSF